MTDENHPTDRFSDAQDALDALADGTIHAETVKQMFRDVDGIERSIAVAKARQINQTEREEVSETVTEGVTLPES